MHAAYLTAFAALASTAVAQIPAPTAAPTATTVDKRQDIGSCIDAIKNMVTDMPVPEDQDLLSNIQGQLTDVSAQLCGPGEDSLPTSLASAYSSWSSQASQYYASSLNAVATHCGGDGGDEGSSAEATSIVQAFESYTSAGCEGALPTALDILEGLDIIDDESAASQPQHTAAAVGALAAAGILGAAILL